MPPAGCASEIFSGCATVGLVPTIEYARARSKPGGERWCIVPDIAIATRGTVKSVVLVVRGEIEAVGRVAADTGSRTSVALAQVLLAERFGLRPAFHRAPPQLDAMLASADAALLIGDTALCARAPAGSQTLDLGAMWYEWTGLPLVFAVWSGDFEAVEGSVAQRLQEAKECGVASLEAIAREAARERDLPESAMQQYLCHTLRYDLGHEEIEGLERFFALAHAHGHLDKAVSLDFTGV
jgi:chorismate dehydratase